MDVVPRTTNKLNGTPILEELAMPEKTPVVCPSNKTATVIS